MRTFRFPAGRILTDPAANRRWYDDWGVMAGGCDCAYCRNFLAAYLVYSLVTFQNCWCNTFFEIIKNIV